MNQNHYIAIEGGGTKFICAHGSADDLYDRIVIKTQSPTNTLNEIIAYIRATKTKINLKAIGLAVFGPLDLDEHSKTFGHITTTAKPGWQNFNIVGALKQAVNLPIGFDTDVNGAAIGEHQLGAARGLTDFLYLTVGTGIGGGVMLNGKLLHGALHPEMGHIFVPQHFQDDSFKGACVYHQNCLEGLASGPAIATRWQVDSLDDLAVDHSAWDLEAHYLGVGIANFILTFAPQRIIIGGGVIQERNLLPKIHRTVLSYLNGYIKYEAILQRIDEYIVKPGLRENSGIYGAMILAEKSFALSLKSENYNY